MNSATIKLLGGGQYTIDNIVYLYITAREIVVTYELELDVRTNKFCHGDIKAFILN